MKEIKLTKNKVAIVDDDDYERLSKYKWHCSHYSYAVSCRSNNKKVLMHREILNCPKELHVDHRNGNRLDNRKENLRLATRNQNQRNSKRPKTNTSGYKGVSFDKRRNKFRSTINVNNKQIFLGYFKTAPEAAKAYDEAALKYHKEFARGNNGNL